MNNLFDLPFSDKPQTEKDYYEYVDFNGGAEDESQWVLVRVYNAGHEEIVRHL